MTKQTRRQWSKLALGALVGAAVTVSAAAQTGKRRKINSRVRGVQLGAQTYSFRDRTLDELLAAMAEIGIGSCELWAEHVEPKELVHAASWREKNMDARKAARERLRHWRLTAPLSEFSSVRQKFARAGVELYAYNYSMHDDFTDEEIERGFVMARALGAKVLTSSSQVTTAKRIDKFARRYRMRVGMHNHSNIANQNEFATPDSFARALQGASPYMAINLDIGHFTAANFDAVEFLRQHHARIVTLHIKDRKREQGPNVPFGEGDSPIKQTLTLLRDNKWPIPANIEYEYDGSDTIVEVKRCLDYCKQALNA